jgi:copper(I)-binding protein
MKTLSTALGRRASRRWMSAVLALTAFPALAANPAPTEYRFDTLRIDQPIARATPPGAKTGAVYFTIENEGNRTERLLHASTPIASGVALHQMAQTGGMMTMRAVPSLEILPGARVELGPGAYHLMLIELKQPLKAGDKFPLVLTFQRIGTVTTTVTVEDMDATSSGRR